MFRPSCCSFWAAAKLRFELLNGFVFRRWLGFGTLDRKMNVCDWVMVEIPVAISAGPF